MILTQAEKMVWAAAWDREINNRPLRSLCRDEAFRHRRCEAMNEGLRCVWEMRQALKESEDGVDDYDVEAVQMLRAMLGDEG